MKKLLTLLENKSFKKQKIREKRSYCAILFWKIKREDICATNNLFSGQMNGHL